MAYIISENYPLVVDIIPTEMMNDWIDNEIYIINTHQPDEIPVEVMMYNKSYNNN